MVLAEGEGTGLRLRMEERCLSSGLHRRPITMCLLSEGRTAHHVPRSTFSAHSFIFSFFLIFLRQEEKQELPSASCGTDSGRDQDRAQPRRDQLNRVGNTASYSIRCSICMSQGAGSRRQMETTLSRLGLCDVAAAECACGCPRGACARCHCRVFLGVVFFLFLSGPRLYSNYLT